MKEYPFKLLGDTYKVHLYLNSYSNNSRLFIGAVDAETGEAFCDITVNVMISDIEDDEILVPEYKLEGVVAFLEENGIATVTGKTVRSGWVDVPVMKLTPAFMAENNLTSTKNIIHA